MKMWQHAVVLGAIFVIGVIIVVTVRQQLPSESTPTADLDIEIAKAALTACIVAVLGVVISALVKAREQRVQAARIQAELLNQFVLQLGEYYRSVKATRRRLRSYGLTTRFGAPPDDLTDEQLEVYTESMDSIGKAQLGLENFKIQFQGLPLFSGEEGIASHLGNMEDYLRQIQKEQEQKLSKVRSGKTISFSELKRLNEFTADTHKLTSPVSAHEKKSNYRFKSHFAEPYDCIWEQISRRLANLSNA